MKSILQSIALLSAAVLIASCDSSSGGGAGVAVTPPAPQVSATGSAVKGIIDGATVTATDAGGTGNQIGSSTVLNGTYDIAYDIAAFPTITDPIVVTVTGGSALCDFENPDNSGNDCRQLDDTFVAFGQSYDITGTVLRSNISAGSAGGISSVSPLSEIAASKAASPLTPAAVTQANLAISGLIEAISGVSLNGVDFTTIAPADLTASGSVTDSPAQLAIGAFGAAILGSQNAGETIGQTIARLSAGITINPATGNIDSTGTALGIFAAAYARGLAVAAKRRPNGVISAAAANAASNAAAFTALGNNPVSISPSSTPGSAAPIDTVRAFVTKLGSVVGELLGTTGAQGSGGATAVSSTEALAAQLDAVAAVSSTNATKSFTRLDAALKADAAAITAGTKTSPVTNAVETEGDDGLAYVLTQDATSGFTVTGVSSRWPLTEATGGNTVTLTADTATATGSTFSIPAATLTTTSGTTTTQTFTGSASRAAGTTAGTSDLAFSGSVTAQTAGTSLSIALTATGVADASITGDAATGGTYTANFSFASATANDVSLTLSGTIGANAQTVTFTTPSGTITSTVTRAAGAGDNGASDQITLTDGSGAVLTLNALVNGSLPSSGTIGTFTVTGTDGSIATLGANGFVTYNDGSIQTLAALLFPDPS